MLSKSLTYVLGKGNYIGSYLLYIYTYNITYRHMTFGWLTRLSLVMGTFWAFGSTCFGQSHGQMRPTNDSGKREAVCHMYL